MTWVKSPRRPLPGKMGLRVSVGSLTHKCRLSLAARGHLQAGLQREPHQFLTGALVGSGGGQDTVTSTCGSWAAESTVYVGVRARACRSLRTVFLGQSQGRIV